MPEPLPAALQQKLADRLRFYEDLGIRSFFRDRLVASPQALDAAAEPPQNIAATPPVHSEEQILKKLAQNTSPQKPAPRENLFAAGPPSLNVGAMAANAGSSLFVSAPHFGTPTLQAIREDIGDCIRCKLHKGRNKIVFGDGHPHAKLVFIGEGPGRDEDLQGLPFVGRAGKLLTQMIEAMGLQRSDVYIANVVKCRPPENRAPEKDEVHACSPFLIRQLDLIAPQVIVTLGSISTQTILETASGISALRGNWQVFRGIKLMPTYHPAYLLRNPAAKSEVWKDLQKVMAELGLEIKKSKAAEAGA